MLTREEVYASPWLDNLQDIITKLYKHRDNITEALMFSRGTHTFDDIAAIVIDRKAQFWDFDKSFVLTEIHNYPRMRVMHVFLAGGEMAGVIGAHDTLIPWAKAQGCAKVSIAGRSGWERMLKNRGWQYARTALELDLDEYVDPNAPVQIEMALEEEYA